MAQLSVDPQSSDLRLDAFVARMAGGRSVRWARLAIAAGAVKVDGHRASKGMRLRAGQLVEMEDAVMAAVAPAAAVIPDRDQSLELLFVDDHMVAVNKPPGIASHPLHPGERGTLANALVAKFPECAFAGKDAREAGLGHRLDRETSGVLIAARDAETWRGLRRALRDPSCEKTYLAEVTGHPSERGQMSAEIGRTGRQGSRVKVGAGRHPLPALTTWEVVARRTATSLVRARLHAGRAHQVRAHLAAAGHPIVGDSLYASPGSADAPSTQSGRLRLHAQSVRLRHPVTGVELRIEAPPPSWAAVVDR